MTVEQELWKNTKMTEDEFEKITNELLVITQELKEQTKYSDFERCIRAFGYTIGKTKQIVGLCAAKTYFLDTIESWKNIPMELKHILDRIDEEDKKWFVVK